MSEISYRRACRSDAATISALAISVWVETYSDQGIEQDYGRYIADHLSEAAYAEILSKSSHIALTAHSHSESGPAKLVGFALIALQRDVEGHPEPASELEKLYIHRNFKGRGIGRALFDMAFDEVVRAGRTGLWLSVYHGNAEAIAFYRRLGLQQIGDFYFNLNGQQHLNHRFIRAKA